MRNYKLPNWVIGNKQLFINRKKAKIMDFKDRSLERVSLCWKKKFNKEILFEMCIEDKCAIINAEELRFWLKYI